MRNPRVFDMLAVMPPSLVGQLREPAGGSARPSCVRPRIWLDVGTEEAESKRAATRDARLLRRILTRRGWRGGRNLMYMEDEGAGHNELAWANRFR